ncbi:MAG: serine/threonine-protein kinase [Pirellulales bacterium]
MESTTVVQGLAKVNTEKLVELLRRSNLADAARVDQMLDELASASGSLPDEPERLADVLVERKLITRWQADKLLEGRHKGFFLGKYKLLGHVGTGGMSSVYLAENTKLHRQCAIKVLPQSRVEDSSYLERFYLEAKAAAALVHPNIITAFDIDNQDDIHYFVMEYVEGRDLHTTVKQDGPLDYETAADYIAQAANALAHAHEAGLIHRDIKPANLLVDLKGQVKMLDLGLALFRDDAQPSLTIAHDENVLGTADYLAPEQAVNSHTVDARADIYSLGCTMYYLLTGHPPFPDGTLAQRLLAHQRDTPASIYKERRDAPRELVDICNKLMTKSPDRRVQTAREVRLMLVDFLAKRGKSSSAASPGSSVKLGAAAGSAQAVAGAAARRVSPLPGQRDGGSSIGPRSGSSIGAGDTMSNRDPDTSKIGGKSGAKKLLVAKPLDDQNPADSLSEFVFDMGPRRSSSSATKLKPADSQKTNAAKRGRKRRSDRGPVWIWILVGVGAVAFIGLIVALLSGV